MRIGHIAIWTNKLEEMREFYQTYFNGKSNSKYVNPTKGFESYFVSFDGEVTIEIMRRTGIEERAEGERIGLCHLAFNLDSRLHVDELTERLRKDGFRIIGEPRITGDGFYESVFLDVDGNIIELVAE
ncbi:VOC family protein [Dysgonomonas sp. 520]|uniref:VOC family protein n=1 Tax=Dysgonomonas sp. 520 TaxID=2302931 RepID=UPI0013D39CBE|nr:VOC family protein [Dysgonomonas sp. 520]NDW10302.1 glyoxalase/bleomycin resistance/extradiol dioxygenase family protein [Dysgonomonas sp. 520]